MNHLPPLISDLGLILVCAALASVVFKLLKQPLVLGYLLTGFLVGPHFHFFPNISDPSSISIWAEIGVIFMLFSLGLEFSFKKLGHVGKSALITALIEISLMLILGYFSGRLLGWSRMDSIFLGGILSISSTTIVLKTFDEMGLKGKSFVSLVLGVLVIEDVLAILLLVLLTSIAVGKTFSGAALFFSAGRLGFFLVLWFVLGIYLLPLLFRQLKDHLSNETLLVSAVGLCLLMVIIAAKSGFSPALGAFVMGSLLAETTKGRRIESLIHPIKDLFAAIFFVSVGMLINPKMISAYWPTILFLSAILIVGKTLGITFGSLLSGRSIKQSVQSGLSLGQIGEFSFLIATLGLTLKVTSDFLYPIAVAVSAITTFTTPIRVKVSESLANWIEQRVPPGLRDALARYETTMLSTSDIGFFRLLWREYGIKIFINIVIIIAIVSTLKSFVMPLVLSPTNGAIQWNFLPPFMRQKEIRILFSVLALSLSGPFLWSIAFQNSPPKCRHDSQVAEQLRRLQIGITVIRFILAAVLSGFIVSTFTSVLAYSGVFLLLFAAFGIFFFSRLSEPLYNRIENRFLSHLEISDDSSAYGSPEESVVSVNQKKTRNIPPLAPWDADLFQLEVSANSAVVMKTLEQSAIKEKFGVTLALIERGDRCIYAPTRSEVLLPGDRLFVVGTEDQFEKIKNYIEVPVSEQMAEEMSRFGLMSITLSSQSPFVNKPIRECGIRDHYHGLIVGIEREGIRFLNPDSAMTLRSGDLIWLVGDRTLIEEASA